MSPQEATSLRTVSRWINTSIISLLHLRLAPGWFIFPAPTRLKALKASDTGDASVEEPFLQAESDRTGGSEETGRQD